jgi:hypothetical protein
MRLCGLRVRPPILPIRQSSVKPPASGYLTSSRWGHAAKLRRAHGTMMLWKADFSLENGSNVASSAANGNGSESQFIP